MVRELRALIRAMVRTSDGPPRRAALLPAGACTWTWRSSSSVFPQGSSG